MSDVDRYSALVEQLQAHVGPGWTISVKSIEGERIDVSLSHPISRGFGYVIPARSPSRLMPDLLRWMSSNPDLQSDIKAVNELGDTPHEDVLAKARALAQVYEWSGAEARSLAWMLFEIGALTEEEARWLERFPGVEALKRSSG